MDKLPDDILRLFALELDVSEISKYCRLSKYFNESVYNNFNFLINFLKLIHCN